MKIKKIAALVLASALSTASMAGGLFDGFVLTSTGSGNTWYDASSSTANPDWTGLVATINQGSSFLLGAQVTSWPGQGVWNGFDAVSLVYSIDGGAAQSLNLPFARNVNASDDQWEQLASSSSANIGQSLSAGLHTVNVRFQAVDNAVGGSGTVWLDNGGNGWSANVNVIAASVPEPASTALFLAGLGVLGFLGARRKQG